MKKKMWGVLLLCVLAAIPVFVFGGGKFYNGKHELTLTIDTFAGNDTAWSHDTGTVNLIGTGDVPNMKGGLVWVYLSGPNKSSHGIGLQDTGYLVFRSQLGTSTYKVDSTKGVLPLTYYKPYPVLDTSCADTLFKENLDLWWKISDSLSQDTLCGNTYKYTLVYKIITKE